MPLKVIYHLEIEISLMKLVKLEGNPERDVEKRKSINFKILIERKKERKKERKNIICDSIDWIFKCC